MIGVDEAPPGNLIARALRLLWLSHGLALVGGLAVWQVGVALSTAGPAPVSSLAAAPAMIRAQASGPFAGTGVTIGPSSVDVRQTVYIVCTAPEARDLRFNAPNGRQATFVVRTVGPQEWIDQIMARAERGEIELIMFDCYDGTGR